MKKSVNLLAGQKKFLKMLIKLQRISIFFYFVVAYIQLNSRSSIGSLFNF